jgi:hypothetical protein
MRSLVAGAAFTSVILIVYFRAPLVPVMLGAAIVCGWRWWKDQGKIRAR